MRLKRHWVNVVLLCAGLLLGSLSASAINPVARTESVVRSGNMRFTILTSRMIRIEQSNNGNFEDRATMAIVNRDLEPVAYTTETDGDYLFIRTADLTLRYLIGSTPRTTDKSPNNLSITFRMNGQEQTWYPGKDDNQNLKGTTRTLDQVIGDTRRGDLEKGLLSRAGWTVIDESPRHQRGDGSTTFPLEPGSDGIPWLGQPVDREATDWYFMGYGHDYKTALKDFTRVAGQVPMPPKYIFGYWYSRFWAYSQNDFIGLVTDMERNDIPVDVMIMDMDWHKSGWTGWSWNKNLIPNPTYLINYFHNHGLKTALNLHPADGIANYEDGYSKIRQELGYPTSYTNSIPWKLEDHAFYTSFFKNIMRVRESEGVDFWWLDWQQWLTSPYTEGLSETFWLNHVYYEDMKHNRANLRPVIYHRWGGLGSHRYPIAFSGDTYSSWSTLAYEIPFTSTASNVCYAYWGHDLGGHQGGTNDPELLQRWLQFGVFSPIFRTHATNDANLERRIWHYNNFRQLRETVRLRYRLFPYLYTAARETFETGVGINRPLYYEYPEEQKAYSQEDEYFFGNDILVAPIYTPSKDGISRRTIWLPEGLWWDVTHRELKQGNYTSEERFTTDEFPYYYRAGSIIPNYPTQRTVQQTPDTIVLYVVPGADGEGRLYEDDGNNQDYEEGVCANTFFQQQWSQQRVTLNIGSRQGTYPGIPTQRAWRIVFLGQTAAPRAISVNGQSVISNGQWQYNAGRKELIVTLPLGSCSRQFTVNVENGGAPLTPINESDPETAPIVNEPTEIVSGQLYITGSAVPNGIQRLEHYPDGTFKFHGTLFAGSLYITDTNGTTTATRYCKPTIVGADIVTNGTTFTSASTQAGAEWEVIARADNYRFTVNLSSHTLQGELFTPWYEAWIVGGCTAVDQQSGWDLEKGLPMEQSIEDPYVWNFVGRLKTYSENVEANRFKINGQYDWAPKALHPFVQDTDILSARQVYSGTGQDYKWSISHDGYYRITMNCFLETIEAEYLGEQPPNAFEIGNAAQLVEYAQMVNSGYGHVDAVLTADIDMAGITDFPGIGNDASNLQRFHATFDGQGHRIKNLHMTGDCVALFPVASDNTVIRNLIIDASCSFKGTGRNAAFVSACNWDEWGSRKVEFYNCGNEAEVVGTGTNCAGLLGCNYDGDIAIVMKHCYNAGHIKGSQECAALSGWIGNNGNNRIDHCYNIAEVEGLDGGNSNNLFRGSVGVWAAPNNYCFDSHYSYNTGAVLPSQAVASGELCYLLNKDLSAPQWFQTFGSDAHPLPVVGSLPVYMNGNFYCDGSSKGTETYSNTEGSTTDPHQFSTEDDLCNVCLKNGREPALTDGVYQIGTIGNLVWFANAVNAGSVTSNGALTADIAQGRAIYTPIGNTSNVYRGNFDGQRHSVTLHLTDTGEDYQGIFGIVTDGVRISNLIAKGTVAGHSFVGGIVGGTNGGSGNALHTTLENCGNEAVVSASGVNAGGMIGVNMGGSASFIFNNCYNIGAINGNESGALSGWSGGGWSVFRNCYNAAKVNGGASADFSRNSGTHFDNCYYVEGCNNASRDEVGNLWHVTAAQLANGELRNLLNKVIINGTRWIQESNQPYPRPFGRLGDVNGDGEVTIADVTTLVNVILGKLTTSEAADVNRDGYVTIADVTVLVNLILNKS